MREREREREEIKDRFLSCKSLSYEWTTKENSAGSQGEATAEEHQLFELLSLQATADVR